MIIELDKENTDYIRELNNSFKYVLKDVLSDLEKNPFSKYLLYFEDEKIVGYLNYYLIYDRIEIANFDVLPDYQNRGYGKKLLVYLIDKYKSIVNNITLEVRSDNEKAISIYHKAGFKDKAIRKNYYNGIDGILMEKIFEKKVRSKI